MPRHPKSSNRTSTRETSLSRRHVYLLVSVAGFAALSWEVVWQVKASLSLGVSALGTALTLAATMGGMTSGALLAGRYLEGNPPRRPLRVYGILELVIGLSGILLLPGFDLLESIDARLYLTSPSTAPLVHLLGIVCLIGPPTIAMGATLPLFGFIARDLRTSIAVLYGLNTGGAALGSLAIAFCVMPLFGLSNSVRIIASLNLIVGMFAVMRSTPPANSDQRQEKRVVQTTGPTWLQAISLAATTGIVTFVLEVAWFRALRSSFMSTTRSFAIILSAFLIPLAIASNLAPVLRRRGWRLGPILTAASLSILLATPFIERIGTLALAVDAKSYTSLMAYWFGLSLLLIGPPVFLLGIGLPWLMDQQTDSIRWGRLYATNTVGAIVGSVVAAWILLPTVGFARTSWLAGLAVGLVSLWICDTGKQRWLSGFTIALCLSLAVYFEAGVGRTRVQMLGDKEYSVIDSEEGPDATVSVIEATGPNKTRELIIDGCPATSEHLAAGYMAWMGSLPMLVHPNPETALVICFGTGQTANAVYAEHPVRLDIAELSPAVLRMGEHFQSNGQVLEKDNVQPIIMDGRAWLRRNASPYDVITLEPMPPYFAGSNALYSKEFYELVASRLSPKGVVAQWVPIHMLPPFYSGAITASFIEVFPDSVMWVDPQSGTGILVGRQGFDTPKWDWPGLTNRDAELSLTRDEILAAVRLDAKGLQTYVEIAQRVDGTIATITDDNQLLAYGAVRSGAFVTGTKTTQINLALMDKAAEVAAQRE